VGGSGSSAQRPRKAHERYDRGELSVSEIARLAGVSRQTLYRYLEIDRNRKSLEQPRGQPPAA